MLKDLIAESIEGSDGESLYNFDHDWWCEDVDSSQSAIEMFWPFLDDLPKSNKIKNTTMYINNGEGTCLIFYKSINFPKNIILDYFSIPRFVSVCIEEEEVSGRLVFE